MGADFHTPICSIMHNQSTIHLAHKLWIFADDRPGVFGDGKLRLIEEIAQRGSLREAAATLGISYRKAWGDLKKAEACLGVPLLDRTRGGQSGGGTVLTKQAQQILAYYRRMHTDIESAMQHNFGIFLLRLKEMSQ